MCLCVANPLTPVGVSVFPQSVCHRQRAVQDWGVWYNALFLLWWWGPLERWTETTAALKLGNETSQNPKPVQLLQTGPETLISGCVFVTSLTETSSLFAVLSAVSCFHLQDFFFHFLRTKSHNQIFSSLMQSKIFPWYLKHLTKMFFFCKLQLIKKKRESSSRISRNV